MAIDIPDIKISDALDVAGGNQAELARMLGYRRAYINNMVRDGREYLPENAALRFQLFSLKNDNR